MVDVTLVCEYDSDIPVNLKLAHVILLSVLFKTFAQVFSNSKIIQKKWSLVRKAIAGVCFASDITFL